MHLRHTPAWNSSQDLLQRYKYFHGGGVILSRQGWKVNLQKFNISVLFLKRQFAKYPKTQIPYNTILLTCNIIVKCVKSHCETLKYCTSFRHCLLLHSTVPLLTKVRHYMYILLHIYLVFPLYRLWRCGYFILLYITLSNNILFSVLWTVTVHL